ncbi:MAG: antitoxin [Georgenia sp.]
MGIDDLKGKAQEFLSDEEKSDEALDKAADLLDEKTGGKHAAHIDTGRDALDKRVGNE